MKNRMLKMVFGLSLSYLQVTAQENLPTDPLVSFKNFYEIGISVGGTRVNTNHTRFTNKNGPYYFKKNNYLPTLDASFNYGWLSMTDTNNLRQLRVPSKNNLLRELMSVCLEIVYS